MNAVRIPNIVAIGESARLLHAIDHAARQSYPGVDVLTLLPDELDAESLKAWQVRPPHVAFLEWRPGRENILARLRRDETLPQLPIWLMVRPGESPGFDGLHVSGSLRVHAEMEQLEAQLRTLMDFLKICIYP